MLLIPLIILFLLGTAVGSFLNVVADRLPKGESIVKGRSHCDHCKKILKWYDMIPLVSFALLGGKCRNCHHRLSLYYPLAELVTGILFIAVYVFLSQTVPVSISDTEFYGKLLYYLFITSGLIVVFFSDLKYGIIPDAVVYSSIVVTLLYLIFFSHTSLLVTLLAAFLSFLFFLALALVTRGKGMGLGDVKLVFLLGLFLGFPAIVVSLYVAFLTGAIVGIILILWRKKKLFGSTIPFGPFLVFATFAALFFAHPILSLLAAYF